MTPESLESIRAWLPIFAPTLGLGVSILLQQFTTDFLSSVRINPRAPADVDQNELDAALLLVDDPSTRWLGRFEAILFFVAFYTTAAVIGGGWLAFKVAAKWASWQHVVKIRNDNFPGPVELQNVRVRNEWASWLLARFTLGTLCNVMWGLAGTAVARLLLFLFEAPTP